MAMKKETLLDDAIKGARSKLKQAKADYDKTGSINAETRVNSLRQRLSQYGAMKENEEVDIYQLLNK